MMHPLDEALIYSENGDFDSTESILQSISDDPRASFNLGWHELRHGNFQEGFRLLNVGRWLGVFGNPPIPGEIWQYQDLEGKTLLFRGEGGYGDQLLNYRFVQDFLDRGAKVIISARSGLWPLFKSQGHICIAEQAADNGWASYDYWVPGMSAPYLLGYDYGSLPGSPYIDAPAKPLEDNSFKIGLRWGGLVDHELESQRKIPADDLLKAVDIPGVSLYSFQRDADHTDSENLTDLENYLTDWHETAQYLKAMDLVITSCTSTAHMAGALGVRTWVLVPIMPYYTWALPGEKTPWYDSVTLFRQDTPGQWDNQLKAISERLWQDLAA